MKSSDPISLADGQSGVRAASGERPPSHALFEPGAAHLWSMPPAAHFLRDLAEVLWHSARFSRIDLSRALIFLPTRRAVRGLTRALYAQSGEMVMLSPNLRALGDLGLQSDSGDDAEIFVDDPAILDLPPAIDPRRRLLELAALVRDFSPLKPDLVRSLHIARALASLLDSAGMAENVDWSQLSSLVADKELAVHWQISAQFLDLLNEAWPARLQAMGLMEPAARRALILRRLAVALIARGGDDPVILAGSTGSAPATRELMKAVLSLNLGRVVLPGLDRHLDAQAWGLIEPQHPQSSLKILLDELGVAADAVCDWPIHLTPNALARSAVLHEAMRPAEATGDWRHRMASETGRAMVTAAVQGLARIEADDEADAVRIATTWIQGQLASRDAPSSGAETRTDPIHVITPDITLAQRIVARLERYGIETQISAGTALKETPIGSFLALILLWMEDPIAPQTIGALLQHPLTRIGMESDDYAAFRLDAFHATGLRGPRLYTDSTSLLAGLARNGRELAHAGLTAFFDALAPLMQAENFPASPRQAAIILCEVAEKLAATPDQTGAERLWQGASGEAAAAILSDLVGLDPQMFGDAQLGTQDFGAFWSAISEGTLVAPEKAGDPRVEILGPLEARLGRSDRVILLGLEEGNWPALPGPDPFLSRALRADLGLPSPDERIGLAAHDFVEFASASEVALIHCQRRDDRPAIASRWLWRLDIVLSAAQAEAKAQIRETAMPWVKIARQMDRASQHVEIAPPAPRPPLRARPRQLSVTQIETLIRDPYAIYAKKVLGLRAKEPLGGPFLARLRGDAIHQGLELWIKSGRTKAGGSAALEHRLIKRNPFDQTMLQNIEIEHDLPIDPDSRRSDHALALEHMIGQAMLALGSPPADARMEMARLRRAIAHFVRWDESQLAHQQASCIETKGSIQFDTDLGPFTLTGAADRIDIRADGSALILDIKTGAVPGAKEVAIGLAPQLLLEGAMLLQGGFPQIKASRIGALVYWHFSGEGSVKPVAVEKEDEKSRAIIASLTKLLNRFADEDYPFRCAIIPKKVRYQSDYELLSRRPEWSARDTEDVDD